MEVKFIFPGKNMDPEEKKKKGWENEKDFPPLSGKKKKKTRENEKEQECCLEGKKKWKRERLGFWEP